jgi:hypothetical protein
MGARRNRARATKQDVVTDLVNKVVNLRVLGAAEVPAADAAPALLLTARTANGEFDYRFYQPEPKGDLTVTRNGQEGAFKVAAYVGEPLIKEREDLVGSTAAATSPVPLKPTTNPDVKASPKKTGT